MSSVAVFPLPVARTLPQIEGVTWASQMSPRAAPPTFPTGIAAVDALTGGVPRGTLSEVVGPASSGRTSLLLSLLAQATVRQEVCALVDAGDSFDPLSAEAAGVELERVLWVRCGRAVSSFSFLVSRKNRQAASVEKRETRNAKLSPIEQALKATDFLLQAGGFGLVAVDLGEVPPATARRVPLTSWFRFRRAVEHTPTALVVLEEEPCAKSCAGLILKLSAVSRQLSASGPSHARLLRELPVEVEVADARVQQRKPVRPARFAATAPWGMPSLRDSESNERFPRTAVLG